MKPKKSKSPDAYTTGLDYLLEGKLTDAMRSLADAIRADTGNFDAYMKLGRIYRDVGKPRLAAQIHLELSVRGDIPKRIQAAALRELAVDMEQTGKFERALRHLDQARKLDSTDASELDIRLRMLEKLGRWKEAGDLLQKRGLGDIDKVKSKRALYKIMEGEAFCSAGAEREGRVCFKDALKIDTDTAQAMLHLANSYIREDRNDDALEWLSKFIEVKPDLAELAVRTLERILYEQGRFSEVESILREACSKAPENRHLSIMLVNLLVKKGEAVEALDECERALESATGDVSMHLSRIKLLRMLGQNAKADAAIDQLIAQKGPSSRGFFCRNCGAESEEFLSRCEKCGGWMSFSTDRRG